MKKTIKILLVAFFIIFLAIIYIYTCAIDAIPTNTILFQGEKLDIKTLLGMTLVDTVSTSTSLDLKSENVGMTKYDVKLFDRFTVKEVGVNIIERTTVIPVGQVSGLRLYTNGVLVVGMSEIKGFDNQKYRPYENSGIEEGDMIVEINNKMISDTNDLIETVNSSNGNEIKIKYMRDYEALECSITPIKTSKNEYKLGLWVRDSAAGIGTLSFYEPESKGFAALGHGITVIDTGELIDISNGEFITTKVISIIKGREGEPGKIQGSIDDQIKIGNITKNTNLGIYGTITDLTSTKIDFSKEMKVAMRNEIQLGDAKIVCSLDGDIPKEYDIEIEKIYINNNYDNKSMLIKIVDDELIEKTGGIIQGMSGCPITQNGKFIGAVTNVLVNDPTKGYGIFGDLMIKEMKSAD